MPNKNRYQWQAVNNTSDGQEDNDRKSRSQKKRESTALQEMGEKLASLPLRTLASLGLPPQLLQAYTDLPHIKSHEARRRQMQFIGRLIREMEDITSIEDILNCRGDDFN